MVKGSRKCLLTEATKKQLVKTWCMQIPPNYLQLQVAAVAVCVCVHALSDIMYCVYFCIFLTGTKLRYKNKKQQ